ncbi:hypothetical protein AAKU55_004253 [Oxalobacteraceae bacterium GrIS 1.11]
MQWMKLYADSELLELQCEFSGYFLKSRIRDFVKYDNLSKNNQNRIEVEECKPFCLFIF